MHKVDAQGMVCEDASVGVEMPKAVVAPTPELRRRVWPQHTAALLATLLAMSGGIVMGWSTPAVPYLQEALPLNDGTNGTTIPITDEEGSWLGSLSAIGALVGAAPAGFLSDLVGRKRMLLLFSVPLIASWIMIILVERNMEVLYLARVISGLALGGATVVSPIYSVEIAEVKVRGELGTYCEVMLCLGILYAFCAGSYLPYLWFNIACAVVPVIFIAAFFWVPESPMYLVQKRRFEQAKETLQWFRGYSEGDRGIEEEIRAMDEFVRRAHVNQGEGSKDDSGGITSQAGLRACIIVYGLMALQQICGVCVFMYYAEKVFADAGSDLPAHVCSIIVASVQLVFGMVSSKVVDRLGRRPMLLSSAAILVVCLAAMSAYSAAKDLGKDVTSCAWLPLLTLNAFVVAFEFGVGPIPWLVMAEVSPDSSRAFITSSSVCFNWAVAFLVTKFFSDMTETIGLSLTYLTYGIFVSLGVVFVWFLVPETVPAHLSTVHCQHLAMEDTSTGDSGLEPTH